MLDPIALAARLIQFDTINPPGNESPCAAFLGDMLAEAGFRVAYHDFRPGRANLVATLGDGSGKPLCLTGHLDVVPLGTAPWSMPPLEGMVKDGRLWGRGSSDMKSGVAAAVVAALAEIEVVKRGPGVVLVFTAAEETGCEGSAALVEVAGAVGEAGAVVVAEPTANRPFIGHKGALWFKARTKGVTAHGSTPEAGVNAVYAAARAVAKLEGFDFAAPRHPTMGGATLNVGNIHGGLNVNSVPDACEIGVDIRTVPGLEHARLLEQMRAYLGPDVEVAPFIDVGPIWSDPGHPWLTQVFSAVAETTGATPAVETATFFTDAGYLVPAYGHPPAVVLGPGEPTMAHRTDEWCSVDNIHQATAIYRRLIRDWPCG